MVITSLPIEFLTLADIYHRNGFSLFMVGGTSRDLILGRFCRDFDFVTDANPEEEKLFLPKADGGTSEVDVLFVNQSIKHHLRNKPYIIM